MVEENKEQKPILEELKELREFRERVLRDGIKRKNLKIPRKSKVRRGKLKKGYIGILKIDENRNISAEKQKVSGNAYMTDDGIYHATDGREILFWQGKFPVIIQKSWKTNPMKIEPEKEENETYGDRYKMAKMLQDSIKVKKKAGNLIIWFLIGGAVLFGVNYLAGGGLFG